MSITPQSASEANHPDAIQQELDWILASEPIWSSCPDRKIPWSASTEVRTAHAAEQLATQWAWHGEPRRLGRRFEELLSALLEEIDTVALLKHGLAIRSGTQTIGEIDYLLDTGSEVLHLEVALKFYAGMAAGRDRTRWHNWVGPSCQDRLDLKINHLNLHQLPLSQTAEAESALSTLGIQRPTDRLGLVFGYLLHPWQEPIVLPNQTHQSDLSYWCLHRDYADAFRAVTRPFGSDCGWRFIPRDRWIGPAAQAPDLSLIPRRLPRPEQADCYALIRKHGEHSEVLRMFVMPDQFAEQALQASTLKSET